MNFSNSLIRYLIFYQVVLSVCQPAFADLKWKWVYLPCNFANKDSVQQVQAVIEEAAQAGYNGAVLADPKFDNLESQPLAYFLNVKRTKQLADKLGIELIPRVYNIGYPNSILANDVTLAEAMPVVESVLMVRDGEAGLNNPEDLLEGAPFDQRLIEKPIGWDFYDAFKKSLHIDRNVFHSNGVAYRFDNFDQARFRQVRLVRKLKLKPYRQYRISAYIKSEGVENPQNITTYVIGPKDRHISFGKFDVKETQDWKLHSVVFNSQDLIDVKLYIGGWGIKSGRFWIDDVKVEECLGVNLVRRVGCPVKVTDSTGEVVYTEGVDYEYWNFENLGNYKWLGTYHLDTQDIPIKIKPNSRIKPGNYVKVSYYHVPVIGTGQVGICLSHPETYQIFRKNIQSISEVFGSDKIFLGCDEVRVMNHCQLCSDRNMTSGQLLADTIHKCKTIVKQEIPDVELYTWNDMFDPYHNPEKEYYYLCKEPLYGSWEGLDPELTIVNWNYEHADKSLAFFNSRGNRLVVAGFYDRKDTQKEFQVWQRAADKLNGPKVEGFMYCTWKKDFTMLKDCLEHFDN